MAHTVNMLINVLLRQRHSSLSHYSTQCCPTAIEKNVIIALNYVIINFQMAFPDKQQHTIKGSEEWASKNVTRLICGTIAFQIYLRLKRREGSVFIYYQDHVKSRDFNTGVLEPSFVK